MRVTCTELIDEDGDKIPDDTDNDAVNWNPNQEVVAQKDSNLGQGSGGKTNPKTCTPINFSTGNKYKQQTDLQFSSPGLPFGFTRYYNSQNHDRGILGFGWTATFNDNLTVSGGEITLIQADGRRVKFVDDGQGRFISVTDRIRVIEPQAAGHQLIEPDGTKMTFNAEGRLDTIQDPNGNTQTITFADGRISSVSDNFGHYLIFDYDSDGRLAVLTTQAGLYSYSYDALGNLKRVDNPDTTFKTYIYDDPNDAYNLTGIIDENNVRSMTTAYDNLDRVIHSESAGGFKRSDIEYVSDNVRKVTDSLGNTTTFQLAVSQRIGRIASSTGNGCSNCAAFPGESYQLSDRLWIDSETNAEGVVTSYTHDTRGNLLTKTEAVGTPEQRTTTFTWHPTFSKIVAITRDSIAIPGQNAVTFFDYDAAGNLVTVTLSGYEGTNPVTRTIVYTYNTNGRLLSVDGPRTDVNDMTTFTYYTNDATQGFNRGQLKKVTNATGQETLLGDYNAWGKPQSVTDINGVETIFEFDAAGRPEFSVRSGKTTAFDYDNAGRLLSVTLPGGRIIAYTYTSAGLAETITDNLGNNIRYTYDTEGNRTREEIHDHTGSLVKYTDFTFDAFNRLDQVIYPDGHFEDYAWDQNNNLLSTSDAKGKAATRVYDLLNRLKSVTQPENISTFFGYDSQDNLTQVTDAENHSSVFVYNDLGQTLSENSPDAGLSAYTYDEAGNLSSKTDANGITIHYAYDSLNRLTGITYPDTSFNVTYTYDAGTYGKGRLTGMTDRSGWYTYIYDADGNLITEERIIEGRIYDTSYTYDVTGIQTGITYPNGRTVTYELDSAGRVSRVTTTIGGHTSVVAENITYLPFGPLAGYDAGSGTHIENAFDSLYRLTGISAGTLIDLDYTLDPVGNIISIADGVGAGKNQSFGYDNLYRLTTATGAYGSISYTYDNIGNRLTRTKNGQTDIYQYIAGTSRLQQITGVDPESYTHDSAGNIISDGSKYYIYNQNNRLIRVNENTTALEDFTYNAIGQRIKKTSADGTVIFHYDLDGNLVGESTLGGDFTATYIYLDSTRLAAVVATPLDEFTVSVNTSEGRSLAGINVYAFTESGAYTGKSAATDEAGKAAFNPAEFTVCNYKFRADYQSYQFWSDVVAMQETASTDITIAEESATVQVTQGETPKEGVKVYLFNEGGAYLGIAETTDENGNVYFVLPADQGYKFRADVLGTQFMSDILTVTSNGTNSLIVATGGGTLTVNLEKEDHSALAGIKMYLFTSAGKYLGLADRSDGSGSVSFAVPSGTYKVRADYMGYQFWTEEFAVSADRTSTLTIAHQDVTITVVRDLNGDILAGADLPVYLFTSSGFYLNIHTVTDEQGRAVFRLPDRGYKVRADYLTHHYWSEAFTQADRTVTIEEGTSVVTVTGLGLPLTGVNVYAFNASGTFLNLAEATGSDGMVAFQLPAGDYNFRADYMSSQYFSGNTTVIAHVNNPMTITTGGGNLTLTVEKETGSPMEGLSCYLFSAAGTYLGDRRATSGEGEVEFPLADGDYRIRVDYLGYQFWTQDFSMPGTSEYTLDIVHQNVTTIVAGNDNGDIQIRQGVPVYLFTSAGRFMNRKAVTDSVGQAVFNVPAGEYKIRANYLNKEYWTDVFFQTDSFITISEGIASIAVSQEGKPLEGVSVYVFTETDTYLGLTASTDGNGIVTFRLPAGTYKFRADYMGNHYWVTSGIAGHEDNHVALTTSGGMFDLRVLKDTGEALSDVPVYVFGASGAYLGLTKTTDETGLVSFDLPGGAYRFRADYMGYRFWTSSSTVPNVMSDVLAISHSDVAVTVNEVYGYDAAPLESVPVYLFTASGAYLNIKAATDNQGRVFFNLPKVDYKVRADYLSTRIWSDVFNATDATVNINQGLAGVHVFRTSVDIFDAPVYLFTEDGGYLGRVVRTDAAGMVSFLVPEGAYKFRVDYDGNQTWSDVIYILANEETAVEMDLDVLMSELTRSPNPVRFDGAPPVYEPEKTMVASLGSVQGLPDQGVTGQVTIDTLNFYLNDHLGAPQIVVDEAGAVVWQADYEPFGKVEVTADSSMANQFRLAGQYYDDETGLHYNYHRYYDPRTGRYLTPDPIGLAGGINLYAYVQNNPKNSSDFNGLRPGDVYLFSHTQGFAPLIGLISPGGSYGHVAVELSGRRLLTAASRGVEIQKLDIEVANSLSFDIYRPLNKVDERLLEEFANRAVQNNPGGYNISGLFGISDVYDPGIQDEYTCAEVVWDAYAYSGNNLGYMGLLISPNEISRSPKIKRLHWTEVSETLWQNNP